MTLPGEGPRLAKVLAGALLLVVAACGPAPESTSGEESTVTQAPLSGVSPDSGGASAPAQSDWLLTVYYTAVEEFYSGPRVQVTGRPSLTSQEGDHDLGTYPADFVEAVRDEGTGRITAGEHAGEYLNWSSNTGFWLDVAPRDSAGDPLEPYVSAASDSLERGTRLRVTECGRERNGARVPSEVCTALRAPTWEVRDRFTPGLAQMSRHLDLYIGEQSGAGFTRSPAYATLANSTVEIVSRP